MRGRLSAYGHARADNLCPRLRPLLCSKWVINFIFEFQRYGLKNRSKWLRVSPTHCEDIPWWQEFNIYHEIRNRRVFIGIGMPPVEPQKVYECPLLEARRYENLFKEPLIKTQSDIAREMGITRARVSQIMALLKLAPEIQRELLALQDQRSLRFFSERRLRPLLNIKEPSKQIQEFNKLKEKIFT